MGTAKGTSTGNIMEEQYINKIEAYLKHTLSDHECDQFEKALKNDATLRKTFNEYALAMDVMDQQVENDLRVKFASWKQERKFITRRITMYSALAASILLLVGMCFLLKLKSGPTTYEQLAHTYYLLPEAPSHSMGDDQIHWNKGIKAYTRKDYEEAIRHWQHVEYPDAEINYYLAHCYFSVRKYEMAARLFNDLKEGTSAFSYAAEWYLVLSYLCDGQMEEYKPLLEIILTDKEHPYHSEAIELKRKADKLKSDNDSDS